MELLCRHPSVRDLLERGTRGGGGIGDAEALCAVDVDDAVPEASIDAPQAEPLRTADAVVPPLDDDKVDARCAGNIGRLLRRKIAQVVPAGQGFGVVEAYSRSLSPCSLGRDAGR